MGAMDRGGFSVPFSAPSYAISLFPFDHLMHSVSHVLASMFFGTWNLCYGSDGVMYGPPLLLDRPADMFYGSKLHRT